jgi:hypothetical protein
MRRVCRGMRVACLIGCASLRGTAQAQSYSDADLLRQGMAAWNDTRCVAAARFLFAYLVRAPQQVESGSPPRQSLETAIEWCEQHTTVFGGSKGDRPGEKEEVPSKPNIDFGVVVPPPPSNDPAQRRARAYSTLAVAQNVANLANRCGFSGPRWSSDYSYHYQWAVAVPAKDSRSETQQRQEMLDTCAP